MQRHEDMVDDDRGILRQALDDARDESLRLDDLALELGIPGSEEGEDEHSEEGADVGPEERVAGGILQPGAEETSDDLCCAVAESDSAEMSRRPMVEGQTHLGLPLHAPKQPPSESARSKSNYNVAELQRRDGDIVPAGVESTVEVATVLREQSTDNLWLIREGVGRYQTNERRESGEDCRRELRIVGLPSKREGRVKGCKSTNKWERTL